MKFSVYVAKKMLNNALFQKLLKTLDADALKKIFSYFIFKWRNEVRQVVLREYTILKISRIIKNIFNLK